MLKDISSKLMIFLVIIVSLVACSDGTVSIKNNEMKNKQENAQLHYSNWEIEYVGFRNNKKTGKGIRVAILDTGELNGIAHGDRIEYVVRKVAPAVSVKRYIVSNLNGEINKNLLISSLVSAIESDMDIINMSFGLKKFDSDVDELLKKANNNNIVLISSVGNEGVYKIDYPSSSRYVIAVGAVDITSNRWQYSNYGEGISFCMPGVNINTGATLNDGTSYSAALLTGFTARILEDRRAAKKNIINILKNYAGEKEYNIYCGYGIPNF